MSGPQPHAQLLFERTRRKTQLRAQPASSSSRTKDDVDSNNQQQRAAVAVLATVPVAWGTFEVAVRYVYALPSDVVVVPAFGFSLAYYTVATAALIPLAVGLSSSSWRSRNKKEPKEQERVDSVATKDSTSAMTVSPKEEEGSWPVLGGLELGTYLFAGNLLQVVGLQTVPSDRAAFLLQLTTVFVPLAQTAMAGASGAGSSGVTARLWAACGLALAGVGIMGLDHPAEAGSGSSSGDDALTTFLPSSLDLPAIPADLSQLDIQWSTGDSLIVLAAVAYTFHCIRLEGYAQQTSAVKLAACKASTETAWSALAVALVVALAATATKTSEPAVTDSAGFVAFLQQSGRECVEFGRAVSSGALVASTSDATGNSNVLFPAVLAVIWTGLVPVAYTIAAQSYGQRRVRPVTANLIYTIQPVCTAVFAYLLLHESLGPLGYLGGALIGSAVLLVVVGPEKEEVDNDVPAIRDA